ncbi:MAG: PhzF family phenazine biosynthesis protein [Candidatus Hodarchaeota archaeon]
MEQHTFYIVDVFAEKKYEGNQLAVVLGAKTLSSTEMQKITREMNYSETTFIVSDGLQKAGYDVRIFTPKEEIPFAGHPTLGTAYIIAREIVKEQNKEIELNLKVGKIPVELKYKDKELEVLWMKQKPPTFGQIFDIERMAQILNLDKSDIDEKFPIQEVSTGLPTVITPLKTLDALKRARVSKEEYFDLIKDIGSSTALLFCPETYNSENDLCVRVFADCYDIPEDPATGSANGCLAGYLTKHRYFGKNNINIRVEQGYEINRPSLLFLRTEINNEIISVFVGGKVILVAKGQLL